MSEAAVGMTVRPMSPFIVLGIAGSGKRGKTRALRARLTIRM